MFAAALFIASTFLSSAPAQAAADSVAVLYRADKVIGQVNERGATGRLHDLFTWAGAGNELNVSLSNEGFRLRCARNAEAASCTFRFLPREGVNFAVTGANTVVNGVGQAGQPFTARFESSNGDTLTLVGSGGSLEVRANKRFH